MNKKKVARQINYSYILLNLVLGILVIIWVLPCIGLIVSTFRHSGDIVTSGWWHIFHQPDLTMDNYRLVLFEAGILPSFINTLIITIPATFFTVLLAALAAYPLATHRFPGKIALFVLFLALQIIPLQITLIPVLKLLKMLKLAGTFPAVWLAHTAYGLPLAIYLLRNFFIQIPQALMESAQIDGASNRLIFFRIIIPLSIPALASVGIFQFLWVWSDLLVSLVYLGGIPEVAPISVKITSLMGSLESGWHIITTAAFISMLLPLILFIAMQKYFVKGILTGAVK